MITNRTHRIIVISTILALLMVGIFAFAASAHTATPTRNSSSSITIHTVSASAARRRHVPTSYIYDDSNGYPYYYPSFIRVRPSSSLSFVISNQTPYIQYITYQGQVIASLGPYRRVGFSVTGTGYFYLGLYYSNYTLTVYSHY